MDRGLVIKLKNYPISDQRAALKAANVEVVYTDLNKAIKSLRVIDGVGDRLAIAAPLHILGNTRDKIELVVERIQKKGCEVWDVTTDMVTTGVGVQMLGKALRAVSNENRFGDRAKAAAKSHESRYGSARARRKETYEQAHAIWWDLSLTATVALDRCRELGWSKFNVYGSKVGPKREWRKGLMNDDWEHPERKTGRPAKPWK